MTNKFKAIAVPHQIEKELRRAIAVLREEVKAQDPSIKDSDIVIERQDRRGLGAHEANEILLYVGSAVSAGITKKWVEDILWPKIKPSLEEYTNEVLELLRKIPGGGRENRIWPKIKPSLEKYTNEVLKLLRKIRGGGREE
jgi:hypothetical protein